MPTKPSNLCRQVKQKYEALLKIKEEFLMSLEESVKTGDYKETKNLKENLEQGMKELETLLPLKEIRIVWKNPETEETKEITINLKEELKFFNDLYKETLNRELTEEENAGVKQIWNKHKEEIKIEIEKYGYDTILIIPENLPNLEELNKKLIETMRDPNPQNNNIVEEVAKTYKSGDFVNGGSWNGVKNLSKNKNKLKIVLTKGNQNTYQSNDPVIKATLNKKISELTSLSDDEIEEKIRNGKELKISFETEINNNPFHIEAESLSLEDYLIFQRAYFEKTLKETGKYKHLDEEGWTWLLTALSGSRFARSDWASGYRGLLVHAVNLDAFHDILGVRLSRSFCLG